MSLLPGILFVHSSAELYGADRILLELTAGLRERGHAMAVVLPGPGPLHAELRRVGVCAQRKNLGVLRRRYFSLPGLFNRACRVVLAVRFIRGLMKEQGLAVIHSNTTAVLAGALAARLAGVPHVWHVHEITTRPLWFARVMAHCVCWLSERVVFVSQATMEHMCSLSTQVRAKGVVIHNGIDVTRAVQGCSGQVRAEQGWTAANTVVGMVGRINWWKGQDKLLDCAVALAPQRPDLRFLMVGGVYDQDDSLRQALLSRVAEHGLQGLVAVQDFRPDVGNVLADIDIFVLPSTEPDPFPTVVLEAMAAGKPIIAFRHGGVCEMVEDGVSGLLCAPGSSSEMAEAIERLAQSAELRHSMGQAGRERLGRLFTREAFIDRFSALYKELVRAP